VHPRKCPLIQQTLVNKQTIGCNFFLRPEVVRFRPLILDFLTTQCFAVTVLKV